MSTAVPSFQDLLDRDRLGRLHPVRMIDGIIGADEVMANVNRNVYFAMGSDRPIDSKDGIIAAEPAAFRQLLQTISSIPGARFVTANELHDAVPQNGEMLFHLRHDVDADIVAALQLAQIERGLGIRGTFYLLHTAAYYGNWQPPGEAGVVTFARNSCLAPVYQELQALGHEVAIHTDPLSLYQDHNVDGAAALVEEISWLRGLGLHISGTAPHNSPAVYGASNSAVFAGRAVSRVLNRTARGVELNGKWAPLGVLDEEQLGLRYEADDVYDKGIAVDFCSILGHERWWHMHMPPGIHGEIERARKKFADSWNPTAFMVGRLPNIYKSESDFRLTENALLDRLMQLGSNCIVLSVHPEYYGRRPSPEAPPFGMQGVNLPADNSH